MHCCTLPIYCAEASRTTEREGSVPALGTYALQMWKPGRDMVTVLPSSSCFSYPIPHFNDGSAPPKASLRYRMHVPEYPSLTLHDQHAAQPSGSTCSSISVTCFSCSLCSCKHSTSTCSKFTSRLIASASFFTNALRPADPTWHDVHRITHRMRGQCYQTDCACSSSRTRDVPGHDCQRLPWLLLWSH